MTGYVMYAIKMYTKYNRQFKFPLRLFDVYIKSQKDKPEFWNE